MIIAILNALLFICLAPLLVGFLKWVKCKLQNRCGAPIYQPYRNLKKLFNKETCVAKNASIIFRLTPYIIFSALVLASMLVPLFWLKSSSILGNDVIVLTGLFALARFFLALAGMDIGTAFGGMGASRDMFIAGLGEPALLLAVFTLAMLTTTTNLVGMINYLVTQQLLLHPALIFASCGFALVAVAETGRIPIDNPATHLELTMIHEAMVLEYSGHHLALIEWAAAIKFMLYVVLFINLFFPWGMALTTNFWAIVGSVGALLIKLVAACILLAFAETNLAKFRLFRAPYFLNVAFLLCFLGVIIQILCN